MIRALVFDFDGLILDTETVLIKAAELIHRQAGLPFPRDLAEQSVGQVDISFDLWSAFGPTFDRARLEADHRRAYHDLIATSPILPGVQDYLSHARQLGLAIGLASNSNHAHVEGHLTQLGLRACFDYIRCIEDVSAGKPAPDLYRAVIDHFGVAGNEAVAFEDSAHGVLAAKRAGLHGVAIPGPSSRQHDFSPADLVLRSLADYSLADLLARFNSRTSENPVTDT